MKTYRNLVFDVGGVLIGFRWQDMLADYGMDPEKAQTFGTTLFSDPLWKELDRECVPFEQNIGKYMEKYPALKKDIRWFFDNAEQMAVPRPRVWKEIHRLKEKGYHIYLLSNYSSVLFEKHVGGAAFHQDLDGRIVSFEVHQLKPDPDIYKTLFSTYGLNPEECLYFDDLEENVLASRQQGMDAVLVDSEEGLLNILTGR